jgi:Protein of unknown function (DUF2934)
MAKKSNPESKPKVFVDAAAAAAPATKKARTTVPKTTATTVSAAGTASAAELSAAARPAVASVHQPTQEEIARMAYFLWESRGRVNGSPVEDWLRAEREVLKRRPQ